MDVILKFFQNIHFIIKGVPSKMSTFVYSLKFSETSQMISLWGLLLPFITSLKGPFQPFKIERWTVISWSETYSKPFHNVILINQKWIFQFKSVNLNISVIFGNDEYTELSNNFSVKDMNPVASFYSMLDKWRLN